MTVFLKLVMTIIFLFIWGQLQYGCQRGARASGSAVGYLLMNIFGLILLVAGIYGIWKYKPNKEDNSNQKLDKR